MTRWNRTLILVSLFVVCLAVIGCANQSKKLMGGVEVKNEQPIAVPAAMSPFKFYVADFRLDVESFQPDQGIAGALPDRGRDSGIAGRVHEITNRVAERVPRPGATHDPALRAEEIVRDMSAELINSFNKEGYSAIRLSTLAGPLPRDGWLIQGLFTEVGEGNRLQRAVIGFGKGATSMDAQIGVSDLTSREPLQPFVVFGTVKNPSMMPGAVVTMNPYVAAAKFVVEKTATTRDINKTAAQIVGEILKYREQIQGRTPNLD